MSNSGYHRGGKPCWWARLGKGENAQFLDITEVRGDQALDVEVDVQPGTTVYIGAGKGSDGVRETVTTILPRSESRAILIPALAAVGIVAGEKLTMAGCVPPIPAAAQGGWDAALWGSRRGDAAACAAGCADMARIMGLSGPAPAPDVALLRTAANHLRALGRATLADQVEALLNAAAVAS